MTRLYPARSTERLLREAIEYVESRKPRAPKGGFRFSWDRDKFYERMSNWTEALDKLREALEREGERTND